MCQESPLSALSGSPEVEPAPVDHRQGPARAAARKLLSGNRTLRLIDLSLVPLVAAALLSADAQPPQVVVHANAWLDGVEGLSAIAAAIETARYAAEEVGVDIGYGCVSNGRQRLVVASADSTGATWREFEVDGDTYRTATEIIFWMLAVARLSVPEPSSSL